MLSRLLAKKLGPTMAWALSAVVISIPDNAFASEQATDQLPAHLSQTALTSKVEDGVWQHGSHWLSVHSIDPKQRIIARQQAIIEPTDNSKTLR